MITADRRAPPPRRVRVRHAWWLSPTLEVHVKEGETLVCSGGHARPGSFSPASHGDALVPPGRFLSRTGEAEMRPEQAAEKGVMR
jgi:hypothetical protein